MQYYWIITILSILSIVANATQPFPAKCKNDEEIVHITIRQLDIPFCVKPLISFSAADIQDYMSVLPISILLPSNNKYLNILHDVVQMITNEKDV